MYLRLLLILTNLFGISRYYFKVIYFMKLENKTVK